MSDESLEQSALRCARAHEVMKFAERLKRHARIEEDPICVIETEAMAWVDEIMKPLTERTGSAWAHRNGSQPVGRRK